MDNPTTWNVAALAPITRSYTLGVGTMNTNAPTNTFSAWAQDDWRIGNKLTLNIGVRYDVATGTYAEDVTLLPWLDSTRTTDTNNIAPRLGATYALTDKTVFRGGYGYFADIGDAARLLDAARLTDRVHRQVLNDGRSDFVTNPFNGPAPTYDQVLAKLCSNDGNAPGCFRRSITSTVRRPEERHSVQPAGFVRRSASVRREHGGGCRLSAFGQPRTAHRDQPQPRL